MIVRRSIVTPAQQHQRALTWLLLLAVALTILGVTGTVMIVRGAARGFGL